MDVFILLFIYTICLQTGGMDSKFEEAFRKDYGRLGELRSLVHRDVPLITLTATATKAVWNTIMKYLSMNGCVEILGDPNKTNVHYAVVDINSSDLYGSFSGIFLA